MAALVTVSFAIPASSQDEVKQYVRDFVPALSFVLDALPLRPIGGVVACSVDAVDDEKLVAALFAQDDEPMVN